MSKNPQQTLQNTIQNLQNNQQTDQFFDIDNWITDFENGFLDHLAKGINPDIREGYHGLGQDGRPRINELNIENNAQQIEGYRVIEFLPNRDNKTESYILFGTPLELQTQVTLLYNVWKMLRISSGGGNDGDINGKMPRNKPLEGIYIKYYVCTKKQPPFYKPVPKPSEKNKINPNTPNKPAYFSLRYVTIPVVNVSKLNYDFLKSLGSEGKGSNGQNWGNWSARAYLKSDVGIHQMSAMGSSEDRAIKNLEKYIELTTAIPFRPITTHHYKLDLTMPEKFEVFPAFCHIIHYGKMTDLTPDKKKVAVKERVIKSEKIDLFYDKPPSFIIQKIAEIIKKNSSNKS